MWKQPGFVIVSDVMGGLPLVHTFELTEGGAKSEEGQIIARLPEDLRTNLRILPATLTF